jgi:hypothetical protein
MNDRIIQCLVAASRQLASAADFIRLSLGDGDPGR